MTKYKKDTYTTGNIIEDLPHCPDNYKDHRLFRYTMRKSKERKVSSNIWKEVWSVVQWRNVKPPRVDNLWSFETKEEAESFMKKNDFVVFEKQN